MDKINKMDNKLIIPLLGVFVGDSIGAYLEFKKDITDDDIRIAFTFPGGGVFNVGKGQPTDDSELTMALLQALIKNKSNTELPVSLILDEYKKWFHSHPFDIGNTTRIAFSSNYPSYKHNHILQLSESNGSLMRVIPIPIWYHNLPYETIMDFSKHDALLSHPNIVCQEVNAIYSLGIAYLINNTHDSHGTITLMEEYVKEKCASKKVCEWFYNALSSDLLETINCRIQIGHVKHAFQLSIHFLFYEYTFEKAIYQTLKLGGDTDTNCAIVGGMIATFNNYIPSYLIEPVLNFDCTTHGQIRPKKYSVKENIHLFCDTLSV